MSWFYSASEKGFYADTVHKGMPSDAKTITDDLYAALMAGASPKSGPAKEIQPDENGNPVLVDQPDPDPGLILKAQAQVALNKSDVTVLRGVEDGSGVSPEWRAYRKALRDIISKGGATELPPVPEYPEGT